MTRYRVLPGSSRVATEMRSNVHPIHAESSELTGVIDGELGSDGQPDFERPHRARLEVGVETMRSGNRLQDMEMRRRLEVGRFPLIELRVDRAWRVGEGDGCRAAIEVVAHGCSRLIEADFELRADGGRLVMEGQHDFDMRDFGVSPPRIVTLRVEPEVRVRARIVAEQEGSR